MAANFWTSSHFQQWLFDKQEIALLRAGDIDSLGGEDQLARAMIVYTSITQCLGEYLKVRQQVIATACVYFKRFYLMYGFGAADPLLLIPTAICLAGKAEETGLLSNTRLIHGMQSHVRLKFPYVFHKPEYPYNMKHIQECEFFLIEIMDCCLIVFQPYRPLSEFMERIREAGSSGLAAPPNNNNNANNLISPEKCKILFDDAWRFVNDSLKTDLSLIHPPSYIALSCLHLASISRKVDLTQWFAELAFDLDLLQEIDYNIINMYEAWSNFDERSDFPLILERMAKPKMTLNETSSLGSVASSAATAAVLNSALQAVNVLAGNLSATTSSQQQQQQQHTASLANNIVSSSGGAVSSFKTSSSSGLLIGGGLSSRSGITAAVMANAAAGGGGGGLGGTGPKGKEGKRARWY